MSYPFGKRIITPEVDEAIAERAEGASSPISVIVSPTEGHSPEEVKHTLEDLGITARDLEITDQFLFASLLPNDIQQLAQHESVKRIWLDRPIEKQIETSAKTIQAVPDLVGQDHEREICEDITWAVLDDGIDGTHQALAGCNVKDFDFTGEGPVGGHGTHIAGIIAGYAEADSFYGIASKCQILNFKVLGSRPGSVRAVIKAMELIRKTNEQAEQLLIHGANISLGYLNEQNFKVFAPGHSPICDEANRLVASGVCVAVSAGNFGAQAYRVSQDKDLPVFALATIADPGQARDPVTVGSTHKEHPDRYGVSVFSSKGPTGDGRLKPELVAPGERIISCVPGGGYLEQSGTSQAAAHVSGIMAFLLHRFPYLVGKPQIVKQLLLQSSRDLLRDRYFQGHGLASLASAVQLAGDLLG